MEPIVRVEGLTKHFRVRTKAPGFAASVRSVVRPTYRTIEAVRGLDFAIQSGEVLAFIGPNGAGKSTTIKLITGILHPDSGTVAVLGLDPHKTRKALAYRIGTVFGQKSQLWFHLPAADSFYLLGAIYDMSKIETRKRIDFLTDIFELSDFADQPVRKLSLGQRIRCEMAASLIHRPRILFLDEPSIGLDVVVKQRVRDLIGRINTEEGVTIFLTSHDAGDIEKICRRAMVINHGGIVWDGTVKEMKYSLLNKRIVEVKMDGPARIDMPGVTELKRKEHSLKLEVDIAAASTEAVISALMRQSSIRDITISSTPMEEVISHIYEGSAHAPAGESPVRSGGDSRDDKEAGRYGRRLRIPDEKDRGNEGGFDGSP
ncbi:MAG: ATP-binding cassette domain-containing protein [Spirochaetales bacterium]|nr:ATP-binding cassette domain-containing protein [Spirochaetales bacterium]